MGEYIPYNGRKLERIAKTEKRKGNVIVLAGGSFDSHHEGHVYFLRECKKYGYEYLNELFGKLEDKLAILFVNVKNNKRVRLTKGRGRPVFDGEYRAAMISSIDAVDYSTVHPAFNESPTMKLAHIIKPDIMVKGDEGWTRTEKRELRKYLGYKVRLEDVERYQEINSTGILRAMSIVGILNRDYMNGLKEKAYTNNHS